MRARLLRRVIGVVAALSLMEITFSPAREAKKEPPNFSTPPSEGSKAEQPLATPSGETAARIRIGAGIFRQYCLVCHGPDGKGSIVRPAMSAIPDFTSPAFHKERDARLMVSILHGKGTFMIAFNSRVTQEQAGCLVAYIRTFQPQPVQPDKGGAKDEAGKKPIPPLIRAQLELLELQKKHVEEELLEQVQQLEQDTQRQIARLRQQARRQTELLDAQKKLYLAKAESQLAQRGIPTANVAGQPSVNHAVTANNRSEERRVGKECRSRWSPYH